MRNLVTGQPDIDQSKVTSVLAEIWTPMGCVYVRVDDLLTEDQWTEIRRRCIDEAAQHCRVARQRSAEAFATKQRQREERRLARMRELCGGDPACVVCGGTTDLTLDHIIPRSRGGSDRPENLQVMCRSHNSAKGAQTMDEWESAP